MRAEAQDVVTGRSAVVEGADYDEAHTGAVALLESVLGSLSKWN